MSLSLLAYLPSSYNRV